MSRLLEGENMNQPDAQTAPNYVTCLCQHCGGKIEFDANQLDAAENTTVPCPHCASETIISVPKEAKPLVTFELANEIMDPDVQVELGEIHNTEMWQAGAASRALRPKQSDKVIAKGTKGVGGRAAN